MKLRRRPVLSLLVVSLLSASTPLMMGGCNQLRGEITSAFATAVRSIVDSAVTLFFNQYQTP